MVDVSHRLLWLLRIRVYLENVIQVYNVNIRICFIVIQITLQLIQLHISSRNTLVSVPIIYIERRLASVIIV